MDIPKLPGFTGEASLYRTAEQYSATSISDVSLGQRVLAQLQQDIWTTDKICKACGCTVSGFACNCGLRPDPRKLDCIRNGGPSRAVQVFGGFSASTGVLRGNE